MVANALREIRQYLIIWKLHLLSAAELRTAFILQIIGMFINNFAFVLIWIFFFEALGNINGWSSKEMIALMAMAALVYGICFAFFSGSQKLPIMVSDGSFDNLLLLPRSIYTSILNTNMPVTAFGDILHGIVLFVIYFIIQKVAFIDILIILLLIPASVIIIVNVGLCFSLISFLFPDALDTAQNMFEMFFTPSLYPGALYQGVVRFIFLFIIPSLALASLPVENIIHPDPMLGLIIWSLALWWLFLAKFLLNKLIKRYESGNLLAKYNT